MGGGRCWAKTRFTSALDSSRYGRPSGTTKTCASSRMKSGSIHAAHTFVPESRAIPITWKRPRRDSRRLFRGSDSHEQDDSRKARGRSSASPELPHHRRQTSLAMCSFRGRALRVSRTVEAEIACPRKAAIKGTVMDELEDLRELRRLLEVMAYWNCPPPEDRVGSLTRFVLAKEAVLRKLKEINKLYPIPEESQ